MRIGDWLWQIGLAALLSSAMAELVLASLVTASTGMFGPSGDASGLLFFGYFLLIALVVGIVPAILIGVPVALALGGALYAAGLRHAWARGRAAWASLGLVGGMAGMLLVERWIPLLSRNEFPAAMPQFSFMGAGIAGALFFRQMMLGLAPVGGWEPVEQA